MTIKLLQLPWLVTNKIYGMLSIAELINMSFVSRKMWKILNMFLSQKNAKQYQLCVLFSDQVTFKLSHHVTDNIDRGSEDKPGKNIAKSLVPETVNLFNNPGICYEICDLFPEIRSEIDFVQTFNLRIDEVRVRVNIPDQRIFKILFELCMTSSKVYIHSKIPDNLNFDRESYQPFRGWHLEIYDAHWVTPNVINVLFANCETLSLFKTRWSPDMVTEFLKNWIRRSKLKDCRIRCYLNSIVDVLKDIPFIPVNTVQIDNSPFNDAQLYQIEQNDGTVAQLMYSQEFRWVALNTVDQP